MKGEITVGKHESPSDGSARRNPSTSHRPTSRVVKLSPSEMARLQELLDQRFSLSQAVTAMGLTEADVRRSLGIKPNAPFTDVVVTAHIAQRIDKNRRGVETANRRASNLERRVNDLEKQLGDNALAALAAAKVGGRKSFIQALRESHVSDDDIRTALVIIDNGDALELSDAQLFTELFTAYSSLRREVSDIHVQVNLHTEILGDNGERFTELQTQVTTIEEHYTDLRGDSFSAGGFIAGCVIGLLAGIVWAWHNFDQTIRVGTAKILVHSWAEDWWAAWLFGIAVGLIVFGLVSLFASGRGRESHSTETITTTEQTHNGSRRRFSPWTRFTQSYQATRAARREQARLDREAGTNLLNGAPGNDRRAHDPVPHDSHQEVNA